jgi:hypothetical protein
VATANPPWAEVEVLVAGVVAEVLVAEVAAEAASRSLERRLRATGPMPLRPRHGQDEVVRAAAKELAAFAEEAVAVVALPRGRGHPRGWGTLVSLPLQ